jgi:uncharacterized protein YgiB involved in biofilm formation
MKKYLSFALFATAMFFMLQSCKKPGHDTEYITLNETIQAGNTYKLNLNAYGDADDEPSITTQAKNFTVSQINKDAVTANNIYNFSLAQKVAEKQTVVITLKEPKHHGGRGCNRDEAVITINFTVE